MVELQGNSRASCSSLYRRTGENWFHGASASEKDASFPPVKALSLSMQGASGCHPARQWPQWLSGPDRPDRGARCVPRYYRVPVVRCSSAEGQLGAVS